MCDKGTRAEATDSPLTLHRPPDAAPLSIGGLTALWVSPGTRLAPCHRASRDSEQLGERSRQRLSLSTSAAAAVSWAVENVLVPLENIPERGVCGHKHEPPGTGTEAPCVCVYVRMCLHLCAVHTRVL